MKRNFPVCSLRSRRTIHANESSKILTCCVLFCDFANFDIRQKSTRRSNFCRWLRRSYLDGRHAVAEASKVHVSKIQTYGRSSVLSCKILNQSKAKGVALFIISWLEFSPFLILLSRQKVTSSSSLVSIISSLKRKWRVTFYFIICRKKLFRDFSFLSLNKS